MQLDAAVLAPSSALAGLEQHGACTVLSRNGCTYRCVRVCLPNWVKLVATGQSAARPAIWSRCLATPTASSSLKALVARSSLSKCGGTVKGSLVSSRSVWPSTRNERCGCSASTLATCNSAFRAGSESPELPGSKVIGVLSLISWMMLNVTQL